jgi:arylformamidase
MVVFIHGGYWRLLDKSDHSWAAPALVDAGVLVVNLNYDLCPLVTLDEIVLEARRAIVHLHGAAAQFIADPDRIFVVGHSAGAHMAAMLMNHDWEADGLPADLIKGAACISGIYEPAAVMRISVNEDVRLDAETAARNDCVSQPPRWPVPVLVAVGGDEPEGWRQQSLDYAQACRGVGCETELMVVDGANHFTVAEAIAEPDSALFQALLAQIKSV